MRGKKAENKVANSLRRYGASVTQSKGSKGSADGIASWQTGREWYYQVKYSSKGNPSGLSAREKKNLIARADKNKATPVLIHVTPEKIEYASAKTGRKLKP